MCLDGTAHLTVLPLVVGAGQVDEGVVAQQVVRPPEAGPIPAAQHARHQCNLLHLVATVCSRLAISMQALMPAACLSALVVFEQYDILAIMCSSIQMVK